MQDGLYGAKKGVADGRGGEGETGGGEFDLVFGDGEGRGGWVEMDEFRLCEFGGFGEDDEGAV